MAPPPPPLPQQTSQYDWNGTYAPSVPAGPHLPSTSVGNVRIPWTLQHLHGGAELVQ